MNITNNNGVYSYTSIDEDGIKSSYFFDSKLYYRIRKAKEISYNTSNSNKKIVEHPLTDKLIERNGKKYIVQNVYKFWWLGYYLHALLRRLGTESHGSMDFENISCECEHTIQSINENNYKILN